mgnify:CR=1 FL=1
MKSKRVLLKTLAAAAVSCMLAAPTAQAQQKPVIKVSSLTLPVFNPLVWNVMKGRGIDAKHETEATALVKQRDHADSGAGADKQREVTHGINAAAPRIGGVARKDHVIDGDLPVNRGNRDRQSDHQRKPRRIRRP